MEVIKKLLSPPRTMERVMKTSTSPSPSSSSSSSAVAAAAEATEYEDLLPVMAEKLDVEAFVAELCGGFRLLADPERGLITADSLRKNSMLLGMDGTMSKEDSEAMVREGDLDGDGALNENEFCILMIRLSPGMMEDAETWLEKALEQELRQSSPAPPASAS